MCSTVSIKKYLESHELKNNLFIYRGIHSQIKEGKLNTYNILNLVMGCK